MDDRFLAFMEAEMTAQRLWDSAVAFMKAGELGEFTSFEDAFKSGVVIVLAEQHATKKLANNN